MPKKAATPKESAPKTRTASLSAMALYHKYMKTECVKVEKAHPGLEKKQIRKMASANWATASENPKNKKKEQAVVDEE
jgi:hypothetical protein